MTLEEIRRVGIVGAGTMGGEIGFVSALGGYAVLLYDVEQSRIDTTLRRLELTTRGQVASGLISESQRQEALARIAATTEIERVAQCDLLSESVYEELAVKREGDPALERVAAYLGAMVERGELGMKSGKGFYEYPVSR